MSGYKILTVGEVRLSKAFLRKIPDGELEFLVSSGLASNDMVIVLRCVIACMGSQHGRNSILREVQALNHLVFSRLFAAKLYEFMRYLTKYLSSVRRQRSHFLSEMAPSLLVSTDELRKDSAFKFVDRLRHNATNHI